MSRKIELINSLGEEIHPATTADLVKMPSGLSLEQELSGDMERPTVTHEEANFKAGIGDSDISASVVDGFATHMTIKGQTYQNILPEPSTHVLTNNKEMFKVNEGLDPNVEIVDGVSKSAILKGQTLVNVSGEPIVNLVINSSSPKYLRQHILKKDTMYTFIYDIEEVTGDASGCWGRFNYTDGSFKNVLDKVYTTGTTKVVTSFDKDLDNIYIGWIRNHAVGQSVKFKSVMILEGDWTDKELPPYFDGMASCKVPVLTTTGKNLYDPNNGRPKNLNFFYNNEQKNELVSHSTMLSCSVPITKGKKYSLSFSGSVPLKIHKSGQFEEVKNGCTSKVGHHYTEQTITAQMNGYWVIMFCHTEDGVTDNWTQVARDWENELNLMIVEDDTPSSYEPYKSNILHTTNLLSNTTLTQGCINTDGSLTTSGESASYSVFTEIIPVKPNTEYYIATDNADITYDRIAYYNSSKTFMRRSDTLYASKSTSLTIPNDTYYIRIAFYQGSGIQITPQQLGNAVCQEMVVLRSLPNGVKDTLNLNTGEYVQRIGEITVCPTSVSQIEILSQNYANTIMARIKSIPSIVIKSKTDEKQHLCDKYPYEFINDDYEHVYFNVESNPTFAIFLKRSKLSSQDANGVFQYLSNNPIVIQSELATPVVKTVDLSSSGNWEKIVLDGSESWTYESPYLRFYTPVPNMVKTNNYLGKLFCDNPNFILTTNYSGMKDLGEMVLTGYNDANNSYPNENWIYITVKSATDVGKLKQYLQQNPITVWYQTTTTLDSTQVKQPIFFKDGHIKLSSGADHSLIPTLDYQAKTSNSYVMDLMKTNTKYTMKAKTASGTFTIDGTSYGAGTNGTFTTPTSMTNKFLVMSNKTNEEVMILEGDLTSKAIPYFKGIKSAFEDESKIEVLSTGKNLFNIELVRGAHGYGAIGGKPELSNTYTRVTNKSGDYILVKPNTKMTFTINNNIYTAIAEIDKDGNRLGDSGWRSEGRITITTKPNTKFIGFNFRKSDNSDITVDEVYQASPSIEESPTQTFYEPYKSNSAKIPLLSSFNVSSLMEMGTIDSNGLPSNSQTSNRMRTKDFIEVDSLHTWKYSHNTVCWVTVHYYDSSRNYISNSVYENTSVFELKLPSNCKYIKLKVDSDIANVFVVEPTLVKIGLHSLRSLPNSVHDEIILDRENGKAQIVQRVNKIILDGSENGWFKTIYDSGEVVEFAIPCTNVNGLGLCNNMMIYGDTERIVYASDKIYIRILKTKANNIETFRNHLQSNPTIVYCELATPIITEADLEGFPYIYKDGHIFLNSEISPVTAITYNTSTAHRIESQNEIIIRHEAKLTELEKLMVNGILETEYQRCLLTLDIQTTL